MVNKHNLKLIPWLLIVVFIASISGAVFSSGPDLPATLPNGVAAGDVTQTSAVLWTHSTEPGKVLFEYGLDAGFSEIAGSVEAEVTDPMLPVKVLVEELDPGSQYFYRATDAAGNMAEGTFRTPAEIGEVTGLRFGVTGDWRGELSPYPAVTNVAARDLDFIVLQGDTIYADFPSPDLPLPQALSVEDFRIKHNEGYSTRYGLNVFAAVRASTAVFASIDDHEVTNDFAGGAPPTSDLRFEGYAGEFINDTELYQNGLQVFQEYNPMRDEFYSDTGDPRTTNKRKLYRYVTFGSDAAIFLLDARSFRDQKVDPIADLTNQMAALSFLASVYAQNRTMLGAVQLEDLKADLLDAQAAGITWKFVMVPEPIQNLGLSIAEDRFEGYAAERTALLSFIQENAIDNVVFITADIHGTLVNNLVYQNVPMTPPTATAMWEISTGPVAFDAPLGPTVIDLADSFGLMPEGTVAAYLALEGPAKETFIEQLVNAQIEPLNYPLVGLQDSELIDAELITGGYLATHSYGWTEFEINAETQQLHVITYGIPYYSQEELDANPDEILARTPTVMSEFTVNPQ